MSQSKFKVDELTDPTAFEKMESLPFSVEASLIPRLGEESVSDKVLSVIELIKNAYDADCNEVVITLKNFRTGDSEIIIRDNGSGMNLVQLKEGWLRIATSAKYSIEKTPFYKRKMLGQKGIGRFAIQNLSKNTVLITYPENSISGYEMQFTWDDFSGNHDLDKIKSDIRKFSKDKKLKGTKIILKNLRHTWTESDVQRLRNFIKSLTPPKRSAANFKVIVDTDEFEDLSGEVNSDFLDQAVFVFHYKLFKSGKIEYTFQKHGDKKEPEKKLITLGRPFTCGPIEFTVHFYYRTKDKMKNIGIKVDDIHVLRSLLDDYGGIKLYRDGIRLSGFGNPDDDWTGLDAIARNDPTIIPSRDQILGMVEISSAYNPSINDTTTRENVIKNQAFQDLLSIIKEAIGLFTQLRGEAEKKRQNNKSKPAKQQKLAKENLEKSGTRTELIDFSSKYPSIFYKNLEDELNQCYMKGFPNATLGLSRKIIENLLFHLMMEKFRTKIDLRFNRKQGRPHNFSTLIENLEVNIGSFDVEQKAILYSVIPLMKEFRKNANTGAHKLYEYIDNIDDIDKLKIPTIIQHEIDLITDVHKK